MEKYRSSLATAADEVSAALYLSHPMQLAASQRVHELLKCRASAKVLSEPSPIFALFSLTIEKLLCYTLDSNPCAECCCNEGDAQSLFPRAGCEFRELVAGTALRAPAWRLVCY